MGMTIRTLAADRRRQRAGTLLRPSQGRTGGTASGMLRIDQEECEVTEPLPELLYSPSLGGSGGGRSPPTKVVDKPPSKAADPPHRIRLEAAMESSFGTFSALTVVPVERLPFVDVSGRCRMPMGPGGSRQLEVRPT